MVSITLKKKRNIPTGQDVLVEDDGQELRGVSSVTIFIEPGEPIFANLRVYLEDVSVSAVPEWVIRHPETGELEPVETIVLKSGEVLEL